MATILTPWLQNVPSGRYAFNQWATDGQHINFQINFAGVAPGYLSRGDVKYYITDLIGNVTTAVAVVPTAAWQSDSVIQMTTTGGVPYPTGSYLFIFRDTPKDQPEPDFNDGSVIDETNLDTGFRQAIYVAAEMVDKFGVSSDNATAALTIAQDAETKAQAAVTASAGAVTTANAAATQAGAASSTANGAVTTANAAVSTANTALSTANGIDAKAQTALDNSAAAVTTANAIDAKAQSALDASAAAVTTAGVADAHATGAVTTANGVDAKATTALSNSATALATANNAAAQVGQFSGKNKIVNGDVTVNLYKALPVVSSGQSNWGPNRWFVANGTGSGGVVAQTLVTGTYRGRAMNFIRQTMNTAVGNLGGTSYVSGLCQYIEGATAYSLQDSTIGVSFIFKSSIAGNHGVVLVAQAGGGAPTYYSCGLTFNYAVADTYQVVQLTFPQPPANSMQGAEGLSGCKLYISGQNNATYRLPTNGAWTSGFYLCAASSVAWCTTTGANINVTEVQVEAGVPTTFERLHYADQQRNCQRFAYNIGLNDSNVHMIGSGLATSATNCYIQLRHPVTMSKYQVGIPTIAGVVQYNAIDCTTANQNNTDCTPTLAWGDAQSCLLLLGKTGAGWTAGQGAMASCRGFLTIESELT